MKHKETRGEEKRDYVRPETVKHEPLDIVRGSGGSSSLYYTYYYYTYTYYYT